MTNNGEIAEICNFRHEGVWTQSVALEVFGIEGSTPDPIPGKHVDRRDAAGSLAGYMVESQTFSRCWRSMAHQRNSQVGHTRQRIGERDSRILGDAGERLGIETLIRGYTLDAAYQLRMEDAVGSLEVGKQADLVVLNRDIFAVPPSQIHQIIVQATLLAGELVYGELPE